MCNKDYSLSAFIMYNIICWYLHMRMYACMNVRQQLLLGQDLDDHKHTHWGGRAHHCLIPGDVHEPSRGYVTCMHSFKHTYIHTYAHTYIHETHIFRWTYIHTYIHETNIFRWTCAACSYPGRSGRVQKRMWSVCEGDSAPYHQHRKNQNEVFGWADTEGGAAIVRHVCVWVYMLRSHSRVSFNGEILLRHVYMYACILVEKVVNDQLQVWNIYCVYVCVCICIPRVKPSHTHTHTTFAYIL